MTIISSLYRKWKYRLGITDYGLQLGRISLFFDYRMKFQTWVTCGGTRIIISPLIRIVLSPHR